MATSSIGELDAADQREPGSPHVVVHAHNSSVNIYNGTMLSEGGAARLHTTQGVLQGDPIPDVRVPCHDSAVPPASVSVINGEGTFGVAHRHSETTHVLMKTMYFLDEHIAPDDPRHKGKWYVVIKGLRVGVWLRWVDMEHYVNRVRGNSHQSFGSRVEALRSYYDSKKEGRVQVLPK